jgi:hypothetical protein
MLLAAMMRRQMAMKLEQEEVVEWECPRQNEGFGRRL